MTYTTSAKLPTQNATLTIDYIVTPDAVYDTQDGDLPDFMYGLTVNVTPTGERVTVPCISPDAHIVMDIADTLCRNTVTPTHLLDILEDLLD